MGGASAFLSGRPVFAPVLWQDEDRALVLPGFAGDLHDEIIDSLDALGVYTSEELLALLEAARDGAFAL